MRIDGTDRGFTPFRGPITPGEHEVVLTRAGYVQRVEKLAVSVGSRKVTRELTLSPSDMALLGSTKPAGAKQGVLILTTPPGARVSINEVFAGVSPYEGSLVPGEYRVRIEAEGYRPIDLFLEVKKGEQNERRLIMSAATTSVAVESKPPGARVFIDGEGKGGTPVMLTLDASPHRVYLTLEGYQSVDETRTADLSAPSTWSFVLQPTAPVVVKESLPAPQLVPVSSNEAREAGSLENALRILGAPRGDPEAKRKLIANYSSTREDLTELVNAASPEPLRDELCVKYAAKVRPVRYSAKAIDSFGGDAKAKLVVNGVDYGPVPFEGNVPWCARSIQARDSAGQIATRKDDKALDARLINADLYEFGGRRRRWSFSLFGEGGSAPFLEFRAEGQPSPLVDLQPVSWGLGGRVDFWGETFHFSLAGKATSLFRRSLLRDSSSLVSPAADFFLGVGTSGGTDAVRYRFAFDLGVWTLVCPALRLVNTVSFAETFFVSLTLDVRYIPPIMAPTLGTTDLTGPLGNFITFGATLAIGAGG